MRYAGVSWDGLGFEVEVLDGDGRSDGDGPASGDGPLGDGRLAVAARRFGAGDLGGMIAFLAGLGPATAAVVDSTNGVLDGHLMAAGLRVFRADPPVLPARPVLGSAPAAELAAAALRDPSGVTRLRPEQGTLTGRAAESRAHLDASTAGIDALVAAGRCLDHGARDRAEVALTFDDGPNPPYTGQILDTLARYAVPATFFWIGLNAGAHPDEVARAAQERHSSGNHTWSHPYLPDLTRAQFDAQVERTGEAIARAAGGSPPVLFRPPFGSRSPEVTRWFAEFDPTVVLWDVDPSDWAMPGADSIARAVLDQVRPGSIVLMHDGGGDRSQTVAALPAIIEGLLARGYRLVGVDALIAAGRPIAGGPIAGGPTVS